MNDFSGWSKYRNIEKIGEGGMGVVYKAFDPQLKRFVALKFVKKDSQDNLKRFVQEAQAQAQLTHKNICRVYEVGEYEDSPYISMQYIDGISLKKATHQLNIDQKVMVMRTVASALYEAHKNGIIHRDIKPANIMLDQNSDGKWVPYVMDFGLAREIESPSLTMSGMVLGTPNYVSPELAMGEKDIVDRRSDIFSLGSTMYDFFTGQRPFKADSTLEILMKVTRHDPIPPRALIPAIPQDMETILLKCLEKEPHRRYDSARAVAEDCRHYLDGEPIKARQPTITYRILKKTKKHKAAFIMAASLFITLLTLVVVWLHSSWAVDRTAEISQRFGQTIESIENSTRISHTIPPHDIRPQIKRVQEQMADLKSQMEEAGSLSSGPGNYALGRGHFILHQYDNALIYLKKSWELGHQTPKVAYVMGLTLGHIYKRELDRIHLSAKQYKKYEKDRLEAKFLKPALEFLKKSWGTKSESPRYLEGVIAFYEKRYMDAMVNVQTAFTACPWLYEAKCMEGEILQAMGNDKKDRGELNGALVDFKRAEAVFRKAIRIGESDPQSYALLCNLLKDVIYLRLKEMGEDVCPIIDETLTIAEKARVLNKDRGDMYLLMATLHRYAAEYKSEHGKEPYGDLAKAIQKAQMAKELEPNNAFVFLSLGETFYFQGYYEFTHGKDPLELFNKAHVNLQKAIKLKPGEPSIHMRMGVLYAYMGYYQAGKGKNPTKSLSAARNNFTIVTEIIPDDGLAFNRIGGTFFLQADYESEHGKDQLNSINQAISFYKKSNAVNPNAVAYLNLGGALVRLSNYQIHHGQNPAATLKKSIAAYNQAIKKNPNGSRAYNGLGNVYLYQGEFFLTHGKDPVDSLQRAIGYYRQALKIDPKFSFPYFNISESYGSLARFDIFQGRSPEMSLKKAINSLKSAEALKANDADVHIQWVNFLLIRSEYELKNNRSPKSFLEKSHLHHVKALHINNSLDSIYSQSCRAHLLEARWKIKTNRDPEVSFAMAETALAKAVSLNAGSFDNLFHLAELHFYKAKWLSSRDGDAAAAAKKGLDAVDSALAINPENAKALLLKGNLYFLCAKLETNPSTAASFINKGNSAIKNALKINNYLSKEN